MDFSLPSLFVLPLLFLGSSPALYQKEKTPYLGERAANSLILSFSVARGPFPNAFTVR